jgi:hypothetical protein
VGGERGPVIVSSPPPVNLGTVEPKNKGERDMVSFHAAEKNSLTIQMRMLESYLDKFEEEIKQASGVRRDMLLDAILITQKALTNVQKQFAALVKAEDEDDGEGQSYEYETDQAYKLDCYRY